MDAPDRIPLARPSLSGAAAAAAAEAVASGWPAPGPQADAFEAEFAALVGGRHVVAVNSGTAALHLAVHLLDAAPGAEVVTTPMTFIATNQVLRYMGLVPVFADIDPATGNIDPADVAQRITDKTAAILVVHYAGIPVELDEIDPLAEQHRVEVIEDCAHACGAGYHGRPIGSGNAMCAFSFNATKNLAAVDGGALVVSDGARAERARRLRWMGIDRSTRLRTGADGYSWRYDIDEDGYRYAMSDLNAAIARVSLAELAANNARRQEIADRYRVGFAGLDHIQVVGPRNGAISANYLFVIRSPRRDELIEHLGRHGIEAGMHYQPNYRYPMFATAPLPNTELFAAQAMSLPMFPGLTDAQADRVIEVVAGFGAVS